MNKLTHGFLAALGASIIVLCITLAFSKSQGEKGKIEATILDAKTGAPLWRASFQILETKQGAYSNDKGIATIINILPGTYTLVAKNAGYSPQTLKDIKVESGKTTKVSFSLNIGNYDTVVTVRKSNADNIAPLSAGILADAEKGGYSIHGSRGNGNSEELSSKGISRFAFSEIDMYAPPPVYGEFNTAEYKKIDENEFKETRHDPLSTFSIDVDGASYSNVRHFITSGQTPPKDAVRIEEMVNYFRYNYPQPKNENPFSITTELGDCPWNKAHQLVLIGLQGKEIPKADAPPANLTFLLDVSGSMNPEERLPLLKRAFRLLVSELRPQDKVAIVVYAGSAGEVLPPTSGDKKDVILASLDRLEAGGSTAGGAGIELAYKVAQENFVKEKNNRVILATDGDFNVGISSTSELVRYIEEKRSTGIYLTTIGVGTNNYKDSRMKELADKGNGNYYYIDNILEAKKVFVTQMGGTLNAIAKDVKIQIEFNPNYIKGYRLIGYESRMLAKEDFNNDKKDAGELGAGHTVTALYEIIPPNARGDELHSVDSLRYQHVSIPTANFGGYEMMMVKFRYKKPSDSISLLISEPLLSPDHPSGEPKFHLASENISWASAVAEFGMLLRDSKFKGLATISDVLDRARSAKGIDNEGYRAEFIKMIEMYQLMNKADK
jgi:Ca-activated chloride channel family protein